MNIHLFGASSLVGESFYRSFAFKFPSWRLFCYSRSSCSRVNGVHYNYLDLALPTTFVPIESSLSPSIWISFAPIWLFLPFVESLEKLRPECLSGLRGLIVCSSSSALVKRFSYNCHDRNLAARLNDAEERLIRICDRRDIPCCILQPTMIYGQSYSCSDKNLSKIINFMRLSPFLILPAISGLRQPIHARQLASVAMHYANQICVGVDKASLPQRLSLGGDSTLSYDKMLLALQSAQPSNCSSRRCRFVLIPNRLFFFLVSPLILLFPAKFFEAVLRICANLSGFVPSHQVLGADPKSFPVSDEIT